MLRLRKTWAALALFSVAGLVVPLTANAYLLPEDVLLSTESLVPPRSRETRDRVTAQAKESSIRREVIQAEEFAKQHPAPVEEEEDTTADTSSQLSTTDMELLRTIRLLGRIEGRQDILMLPGAHTGAPLSPSRAVVASSRAQKGAASARSRRRSAGCRASRTSTGPAWMKSSASSSRNSPPHARLPF